MRRPALLATLLTMAAVAGCTGHNEEAPSSNPPAASPSAVPAVNAVGPVIYAYEDPIAERAFLVRDGEILADMPGWSPTFTANGKYLVTSTIEKVFAMEVATGTWHEHRLSFEPPVGCPLSRSLVGDSVMLVAPNLTRLMLPGLTTAGPVAADLPPRRPGCVVGTLYGDPIVLVSNRHGRQLYRVGADGATRRIGPDPIAPPGLTSGPSDIRFSIAGPSRMSYSLPGEIQGSVMHMLDLDSGLDTVPATVASGTPTPSQGSFWEDTWWSSTGMLHATMTTVSNTANDQLWRVVNGAWEPVNKAGWRSVRELPAGRRLIVGRPLSAPAAKLTTTVSTMTGPAERG